MTLSIIAFLFGGFCGAYIFLYVCERDGWKTVKGIFVWTMSFLFGAFISLYASLK